MRPDLNLHGPRTEDPVNFGVRRGRDALQLATRGPRTASMRPPARDAPRERLGFTVRDTLNLIHELTERGVGVRNLADPIRVDSANPADPMAQLAVVLLALFAQMESTYTLERAAHARSVATAKGRRVGRCWSMRPSWPTPRICARPGTPSLRSSRGPGSPGPACTSTCHPDPPSSSL